jgi:hypothetical protein
MSKFDHEVNKILFEVSFMTGLANVGQGLLGLTGTALKTAGAVTGATTVMKDLFNIDLNTVINSLATIKIPIKNIISTIATSKEDPYKLNAALDFSKSDKLIIIRNFLKIVENIKISDLQKNMINIFNTNLKGKLNSKINFNELDKLSAADIKIPKNITDVNSFMKWLFTIHVNFTYAQALTHFFEFIKNSLNRNT